MVIMRRLPLPDIVICSFVIFTLIGCSSGGEVVKVTTVEKGVYNSLKESDRARLAEIKQIAAQKGLSNPLSNAIRTTPHFSVSNYLRNYPEDTGPRAKDYRVGGYDVLNIIVYEEKDLTREAVRVSADGYISFPFINRLKVDNLTTSEIEKLISRRLAEGQYLIEAHVSVMVTEYNSKRFMVLGAVKNPGSYSLQAQERVIGAISRAGGIRRATNFGYQTSGAGKRAMIIRTLNPDTAQEQRIVVNIDLQALLQSGDQISNIVMVDKDVLFIPAADLFYIIGQVKKTGSYPLPENELTLVEAISMAGGFTPIAARNRTRIIRVENGLEKIIEVKVDAITAAGRKIQDVTIRPNDIIVVPESFF